jgi:hypothetical protein
MPKGRPSSGPASFGRHAMKQIIARVDRKQVDELYGMLREEGISLQAFIALCVKMYIESNPSMRAMIESYRRDLYVTKNEKDSGEVFSDDERAAILRDIER